MIISSARNTADLALPGHTVVPLSGYAFAQPLRPSPHSGDVDALEQPMQLLDRQRGHGIGAPPDEAVLLQPREQQPEAVAVHTQDLHADAQVVAEHLGKVCRTPG